MKFRPSLKRLALGVATATVAIGLMACQPVPDGTDKSNPDGWELIGGDEFNGNVIDTSRWSIYNNTYGDGNNELACLTPNNVEQSLGTLKITSRKQTVTCPGGKTRSYTSGFMGTRETGTYFPRYARFEIRAKLPHAQGLWPAFWLRHRNGASTAEVDILEYFHSQVPGRTTGTLHLDGRYNISKRTIPFESPTSSDWHTWAVEIGPASNGVKFDFFFDGDRYHSYVDTQHKWTSAPADGTWDMAINQAVGGNWVGHPDGTLGYLDQLNRCSIGGTAPNACRTDGINRVNWNNEADTTYEIDYIRVFTKP